MARYQMLEQPDGYAVVDAHTGCIAMANGQRLEALDVDDASALVDVINCLECESLSDDDDEPAFDAPRPRHLA